MSEKPTFIERVHKMREERLKRVQQQLYAELQEATYKQNYSDGYADGVVGLPRSGAAHWRLGYLSGWADGNDEWVSRQPPASPPKSRFRNWLHKLTAQTKPLQS